MVTKSPTTQNIINDLTKMLNGYKTTQRLLRRGFFSGRDAMDIASLKHFYEVLIASTKHTLAEQQAIADQVAAVDSLEVIPMQEPVVEVATNESSPTANS